MRFLRMLVVTLALVAPSLAQQACGPVVRGLGGDYFLVQCNGVSLQVNDQVSVRRGGQEIGRGTVMRTEGNLCSVLLPGAQAQRMDVVYLLNQNNDPTRGPAIPTANSSIRSRSEATTAPATASAPPAPKSKRDTFFSGVGSGGRVLNLNTGEMVTER